MEVSKRATVYFNPLLHRALRLKAAQDDVSISDLVNDAVQRALVEDAEDISAAASRRNEKSRSFKDVVKKLRRDGKI